MPVGRAPPRRPGPGAGVQACPTRSAKLDALGGCSDFLGSLYIDNQVHLLTYHKEPIALALQMQKTASIQIQ